MLIAVLGPDGSGKTTLARSISEAHKSVEYVYLGHNQMERDYRIGNEFIKGRLSQSVLIKPFRRFLITFNDWVEYRISKKVHNVSDRCIIDALIGTRIFKRKMRYYYELVLKVFPKPDFVILLDGDADKIWQRKKELTPDLIRTYISDYKNYLDRNSVNYTTIDTVKNNLEESKAKAIQMIESCLKKS
ncbi:MAG: hypothetical protein ACPGWM_03620 [Flavobacteriales bacterium]